MRAGREQRGGAARPERHLLGQGWRRGGELEEGRRGGERKGEE